MESRGGVKGEIMRWNQEMESTGTEGVKSRGEINSRGEIKVE